MEHLIRRAKSRRVADKMIEAATRIVTDGLGAGNDETQRFYGHTLPDIAKAEISEYSIVASNPICVVARLMLRIGGSHAAARVAVAPTARFGLAVQATLTQRRPHTSVSGSPSAARSLSFS
jgi:hypothetical protein